MKNIITLVILTFSTIAISDVLIIERINKNSNFSVPTKGKTMNQVISQFGEPSTKTNPVGMPPITKWEYAKFTVYFESTWVINTVIHKSSPEEKGPRFITK